MIGRKKGSNGCRYTALNLENSETIEFRFFAGTLDYSWNIAYLEWVALFTEWIKRNWDYIYSSRQQEKAVD